MSSKHTINPDRIESNLKKLGINLYLFKPKKLGRRESIKGKIDKEYKERSLTKALPDKQEVEGDNVISKKPYPYCLLDK